MEKEFLINCLNNGLSTREIEKISGKDHRTISYWINKYQINELSSFKKLPPYRLNSIDTPEKAYLLGFILADGAINNNDVEVSVAMCDSEVAEFIASQFGINPRYDYSFDKDARRFPRVRISRRVIDILMYSSGSAKKDRHFPRIRKDLERYLLLGFFDGDGCMTWGRRKDRNRIWQKVSFTSQLKLLSGVQAFLMKNGISTSIKPKTGCDCFVLDFANRGDVLKFIDIIYPDDKFIVLRRKYLKSMALRLELEENGESVNQRQYRAEPAEQEGVETSGGVATHLNNHISIQAINMVRDSPNWAP